MFIYNHFSQIRPNCNFPIFFNNNFVSNFPCVRKYSIISTNNNGFIINNWIFILLTPFASDTISKHHKSSGINLPYVVGLLYCLNNYNFYILWDIGICQGSDKKMPATNLCKIKYYRRIFKIVILNVLKLVELSVSNAFCSLII